MEEIRALGRPPIKWDVALVIDPLDADKMFPKDAPLLIITDGQCDDRLHLRGWNHDYLIPSGPRLPFLPKGPVFREK